MNELIVLLEVSRDTGPTLPIQDWANEGTPHSRLDNITTNSSMMEML